MAQGEFIEVLSPSALADLDKLNASLLETVRTVKEVNGLMGKITTPSGSDNAIKNLNKTYQQQEKLIQSLQRKLQVATDANIKNTERQRLAELKLQKDREQAFDKADRATAKEVARLEKISGLYNQTQQAVNRATKVYNDLAIKKELNGTLSAREEIFLMKITKQLNIYQSALKKVDATIQNNGRNVGNYRSSWDGLGNSINQLTREFPAFANSAQTGFMAVSNNIPILVDEIQKITKANKELLAQGQPVKSVFSQIASSVLSWGTALSVGVTLLTFYGKEIGTFVKNLFRSTEAIDLQKKAMEESIKMSETYNKKASELASEEISRATKLIQIARDRNASDAERKKAVDELQSRYPAYLGNLKDEEIMTGNITKAQNELIHALKLRALALASQEMITDNLREQIKLEVESSDIVNKTAESQKLYDIEQQKSLNTKKKIRLATEEEINSLENLEQAQENSTQKVIKNGKEVRIQEQNAQNRRINALIPLKRTEEILDAIFKKYMRYLGVVVEDTGTEKKTKELKELTLQNEDYIASQFALSKLQKELEAQTLEKISNDESKSFEVRIDTYTAFVKKRIEITELDLAEQLRLENKRVDDLKATALKEYNEVVTQEGVTQKIRLDAKRKFDSYVRDLTLQSNAKISDIELKHTNDVLNTWSGFYQKLQELRERDAKQREENIINERELNAVREYNKRLLNISKQTTLKTITEIENLKTDAERKAQKERLQLEVRAISDKMAKETEGSEAWNKLNQDRIAKTKQLTELEIQENVKRLEAQKKYLADIQSYLKGYTSTFASDSGFTTLFKALNKEIVGFGENWAVTVNTIMEIGQEMFAFMTKNSMDFFEQRFANLEKERDLAIKFSNDSTVAKEAIERQYDERRRQLERQKAEQQKKLAMFNIIINTAQAIVSALASVPPNIPLSIAVGLIGASQLAMVSSQKIPTYVDGTDYHKGGAMVVNDGKGSNYVETVITPDGKATQYRGRNVLLNAPRGTKVKTAEESLMMFDNGLNRLLSSNGIGSSIAIVGGGATADEFDKVIGKHMGNIQTNNFSFDRNGFNHSIEKNGQKMIRLNARINGKGLNT